MSATSTRPYALASDLDLALQEALEKVRSARSRLAEVCRDRADIEMYAGNKLLPWASEVERNLVHEFEEARDLYLGANTDVTLILEKQKAQERAA